MRGRANFISIPPRNEALVATIQANGRPEVNILDASGSSKYIFYRAIGSQPFTEIPVSDSPKLLDQGNANVQKYCYYTKYIDVCGNISENSPTVCTIQLTGIGKTLDWNVPLSVPNATIAYDVVRLNPTSVVVTQPANTFLVTPIQANETYQIIANITFTISGIPTVVQSISNTFTTDFQSKLYFPSAFTPNGDGINDVFEIKQNDDAQIRDFEIIIFNKWGEIIFNSSKNRRILGWKSQ
ncbi:MAG: gliding motility-associated C-terminal domain-containing protein [Emticicia sp.]|nr:gliding motility-associated C-terminal domain-containing protein [Emticicia sp.]